MIGADGRHDDARFHAARVLDPERKVLRVIGEKARGDRVSRCDVREVRAESAHEVGAADRVASDAAAPDPVVDQVCTARRVAKIGAVKLASDTGRAIVPLGFAFHRCWRAPSWDRFAVPMPFSPCVGVNAEPIHVPPDLSRGELEEYRLRLEKAMHEVTAIAEDRAAKERW